MDIIIDELIVEEDRPEHIAKHNIQLEEVFQVLNGGYVFIDGKLGRWLLIGKTTKKRFLTIIIGARKKKNTYGLVTARPSRKEEKSFYKEFTLLKEGGEKNG
ncbi:MAG TPA: hypothetical protein VMR41_02625 [Patescibacteria group bacterium]|nr:hypothetical protein [Patescibacteria group bacterium]